jgi:ribA/ribD-fused uncharacterized protein
MMEGITKFRGQYGWLSNFYSASVCFAGINYPTVEHAFRAAKTLDLSWRRLILNHSSPADAKQMGRCAVLRSDWEEIKLTVMEDLLRQKFHIPCFKAMLLATGDMEIVEGNEWGDIFWGVCRGVGSNHLGILLMQIRDELRMEVK